MKKRFTGSNTGFTLMELLIVIVIMGFLLGMLVPRLASVVSGDAVDTVCDSNNKGVRYYTKMYLDQKGRFPASMTNLVNQTGAGTYVRPLIEDKNVGNGAETLALEFYVRNNPTLHNLTAAEASELVGMGISTVVNLNDADGSGHAANAPAGTNLAAQTAQTVTGRPYAEATVATGLGVVMVGNIAAAPTTATWASTSTTDYPKGNPNWWGRIILGIGKDCSLVTDGYIQAAALCPGGIQNSDNVTFNSYCIILPRLEATTEAMLALFEVEEEAAESLTLTFTDSANPTSTSAQQMVVAIEAQEAWQFDFTCPEGHKWPDNDNDTWALTNIAAE